MNDSLSVSVIIVVHNGAAHIAQCLDAVQSQTVLPEEVIVVDNASTDHSSALVRTHFPGVHLIRLPQNVGFAGGANAGAAVAGGEILVTLNDDTIVDSAWLANLIDPFLKDPEVGASVSKILLGRPGSTVIDCAGSEFNNLGLNWGRGANRPDSGQFDAAEDVPGVTACSMAVRRTALAGEELFDRELFMYYEEFDLTLRLRGRGYRIAYRPESIVHHLRGQTVARAAADAVIFQQRLANRNRIKIFCRYFPLQLIVRNAGLVAASLIYWDFVFARRRGIRFAIACVREQASYALKGLLQRKQDQGLDARKWIRDMTQHSLVGVLRARRELGGYEAS